MHAQRPYEDFSYPTDFQAGAAGGDAGYDQARSTSPSVVQLAPGGGLVGSTGMTRRANQHASNIGGPGISSSVPGGTTNNAAAGVAPPYAGTYGYFHGHGNSIDVNSGYNSDAGSSISNPRYVAGGAGSAGINSGGMPLNHYDATVQMDQAAAAGVGEAVMEAGNAVNFSPTRAPLPPVPRFPNARHSSAVPDINSSTTNPASSPLGSGPHHHQPRSNNSSTAGGGTAAIHVVGSEGRGGSAGNSTISSRSPRQPAGPPAFLPSRPFIQTSPLPTLTTPQHQQQQHGPSHPSHQPYAMTGERQRSTDLPGDSWSNDGGFSQHPPHMVTPSTAGPRMPASANSSASPYGGGAGINAGGAASSGAGAGRSNFFSRLLAQVIPPLDDNTKSGGAAMPGGIPQERPLHQLRFGNPEDDLPLLEELGIFPRHILEKARAVLNPFKTMSVEAAKDTDLAGPILFAFSLAVLLTLRGKIQFSAIYGLFVIGVAFFKVLLSLMQPKSGGAPLQFVVSTVGYGLLPTVLLAIVRTTCSWLLTRRSLLPLTLLMILWSAWCGTTLVAKGLGMEEQRYLVLYPMLLFYAAFDALTVF